MSTVSDSETLVRYSVEHGVPSDAVAVADVLTSLDRARDRVAELERQLRELRGEKCEHWIDGPAGERIALPTFGCRECR